MGGIGKFINKIIGDKKSWNEMEKRAKALPEDYLYVYRKIQNYMFGSSGGDGMDLLQIFADLLDLFETGAAEGKHVLDITGEDVATFCDDLLRSAKTYMENRRRELNQSIMKRLREGKDS